MFGGGCPGSTTGPASARQITVACPATGLTAGQYNITLTATTVNSSNGCPDSTLSATANGTIRPAPAIQITSPQAPSQAPLCSYGANQVFKATFAYIVIPSPGSGTLKLTATPNASLPSTCTVSQASKLLGEVTATPNQAAFKAALTPTLCPRPLLPARVL